VWSITLWPQSYRANNVLFGDLRHMESTLGMDRVKMKSGEQNFRDGSATHSEFGKG
jgi:hypothetical protein